MSRTDAEPACDKGIVYLNSVKNHLALADQVQPEASLFDEVAGGMAAETNTIRGAYVGLAELGVGPPVYASGSWWTTSGV